MTVVEKPPSDTPTPTRPRMSMPQIVSGGVLVLIGLLWLLERLAIVDIGITAVLGLATMVTGIALMLLARDRAHGGLAVLGTILALAALITATAPFEGFQGGIGDRTIELTTVDDMAADYNLAMGRLTIDLRQVDDLGAETTLSASVGMGDLIVRIPEGTEVSVNARVGAGKLVILDRVSDGIGINETYRSPGLGEDEESLVLDLEMFTGSVEVTDE